MASQTHTIYIRLRHKISGTVGQAINVKELAQVIAPSEMKERIETTCVHRIKPEDNTFVVIDAMDLIREINQLYPTSDIQTIGPSQTIIVVTMKKQKFKRVLFLLVWILLFIGSGLTIMNFHEDVAMPEVHRKIYTMVTGKVNDKPLILQIPYSIGIGIGMILFFNHIFKKRFNEEPSPLEVEMFNYEQDLDRYILFHEKQKSESKEHGNE
ncbi:stage V sporulation protein AA [Pullulanibacillus camelliae]|uniref:Stage V sporulation protein AA n=1 Tax=Pullulanibacillus camelliae TaxID=1707096 RepID=A0A8J2YCW1_9BACL|nr:stage V sporulation protein AA [Pullulanibacillus camelliae]GGE38306.1 stage V sporulation protein AA [Pullulanibacillus camelliae]